MNVLRSHIITSAYTKISNYYFWIYCDLLALPLNVLRSPITPSVISVTLMSVASYAFAIRGLFGTDKSKQIKINYWKIIWLNINFIISVLERQTSWVFVTNPNILILISLQPDAVNLWYFKLWIMSSQIVKV